MFAAWCDQHEAEVLLSDRRIFDIEIGPETVTVHFVCWCGTEGSFAEPRIIPASAADLTGAPHHVLGRRQLA